MLIVVYVCLFQLYSQIKVIIISIAAFCFVFLYNKKD